jgi:outer membrane protein TolC
MKLYIMLGRLIPLLVPLFGARSLGAQQPVNTTTAATAPLSLEQAIALARQNNPGFLQQRNDEGAADWAVREAYGQLLPGASVSTGFSYQAAGTPRFGNFTARDLGLSSSPAYLASPTRCPAPRCSRRRARSRTAVLRLHAPRQRTSSSCPM